MSLPVLNLLNFELSSANKCKYVLTSPRSLKACKKVGIKPVELLYKSVSHFQRETGKKDDAQVLFQAYEMERQRKLALCRSVRNQLLLYGYCLTNGTFHKSEKMRKYSPKHQEIKERALPVLNENYLRKRAETPENMRHKEQTIESLERSYLNLPKVNLTFEQKLNERYPENKLYEEKRYQDKFYDSESKPVKEFSKTASNENFNKEKDIMKNIKKQEELDISDKKLLDKDEDEKENGGHLAKLSYSSPDFKINPPLSERTDYSRGSERLKSPETTDDFFRRVMFKEKRPNSASRRKIRESKRKAKAAEQKRHLQNMKIQYSDPNYCIYKYKQVIENSVERDLKELEVQKVQRELEEGMEKWQDRVLLLQWLDVSRAREQAMRELEVKVERLQQKSRAKTIIHTININKVKEAEDMKAEGLRKQVEEKDRKIQNLNQEKERIIHTSKSRALSIQELKDHIRSIMTPETFDQKVTKLGMHKRVLDSHMCARVMQRSHIWLG